MTGARGRRDQVLEHVAGADARELVGVADQEEVGPGGHRLEERRGEARVEHRDLVDDEEVRGERVRLVRREAAGRVVLEQPVDRGGVAAGRLREALRRAARGRGEVHPARPSP